MHRRIRALSLLTLAAVTFTACKSSSNIQISGAGSTFVYPVMTLWIQSFSQSHPAVQINYQSIGSGGGIQQVKAGTVDFGASDVPLADDQLSSMPPIIQIPETAGPVCITYNLGAVSGPIQLSPESLAGIYLGTIKSWHDPLIAKDNPGMSLPSQPIVVVHRAESSGTTNAFTTYLSAVSPEWQSKVGKGTNVSWPVGLGGKGSEGVTGQLRQSPGAIGYVELTYAQQNHLPVARIKNLAGNFIEPTLQSTTAAINGFTTQLRQDPRQPIVNPPATATDAYPIATLSFLIIPKDGPDKAKRSALKSFFQYIITDGQALAGSLNYAPLPEDLKQFNQQQLNQMTAAGQPIQ